MNQISSFAELGHDKLFFKHNLAILKSKRTNMNQVMDIEKHKEFDLLKEEAEKVG